MVRVFTVLGLLTCAGAALAQGFPAPDRITAADLLRMTPSSPNPYLAYLPEGVEPDYEYWNTWLREEGRRRAREARAGMTAVAVDFNETEPNDSQSTGNHVSALGFGNGQSTEVDVAGAIANASPTPTPFATAAEDNGSISLASSIPALASGAAVITSSFLGDGPHGSSGTGSADYDFFELPGLLAGDEMVFDITTADLGATYDSVVAIYDSTGTLLAFDTEEVFPTNLDALLVYTIQADGTYYLLVSDYYSGPPSDPFDSSSGSGAGTEGDYDLTISRNVNDRDFFTFDLTAGDILNVNLSSASGSVFFYSPDEELLIGSSQDLSGIYPASSPLIGGGAASAALVAPSSGRFALRVTRPSNGAYTAQLRLFRPVLESGSEGTKQTVFVDFDGATVNMSIFGGGGNATLSPLSSFLAGWGLGPSDEDAVIDAIMASIEESLKSDLLAGPNPFFDIELKNSRDHADPFGQANVSRLIVGGTIAEFGVSTIGLAQSIDPGNFETEETGVILLDLLNAAASNPNSINQFPREGGATIFDAIGLGVGNISVHEAGHYFGNFHTEQFITPPNIMDQGGNLANTIGTGPDGRIGSGDDIDVDFGPDMFVPSEGLLGTEDTLSITAFGVTTPATILTDVYVNFGAGPGGIGTIGSPVNSVLDGLIRLSPGGTMHIFSGTSSETFSGEDSLETEMTIVNETPGSGAVRIGEP